MPSIEQAQTKPSPTKLLPLDAWFLNPFALAAAAVPVAAQAPATASEFARSVLPAGTPWLQALNQSNMELMGLLTRRSQALMALPRQAMQCKAPTDVFELQVRFWQAAVLEHADTARRVASAWGNALPAFGRTEVMAKSTAAPVSPPRDRITFVDHGVEQQKPLAAREQAVVNADVPRPQRRDEHRSAA